MNAGQVLRSIPEYLNRNLHTQPWSLALMVCFLTGQIFLQTLDHRHLRLAPVFALFILTLSLRQHTTFGARAPYTKALVVLVLCLSFSLRWEAELQRQAKFYQKYDVVNQGVRPLKVRGFVDEDFTFRINRPLYHDPDVWMTAPFRLTTGERVELAMNQADWQKLDGHRALEVEGHVTPLRQAPNPGGYDAHKIGAGRGIYLRLNATAIRISAQTQATTWQDRAGQLRTLLYKYLSKVQGEEFAGFYLALWTGDRRFISERLLEASDILGLSYRLSPTGQQLGLWIMAIPNVLRIYDRKNRQRLRFVLLFIMILLTGGSISLFKALLLQGLFAYQAIRKLNHSRLQTLGLVSMILLTYRPGLIVHPGFLLSITVSYLLSWPSWTRQQMEDFGVMDERRQGKRISGSGAVRGRILRLLTIAVLLPSVLKSVGMTANRSTIFTMFLAPIIQVLGLPVILLSRIGPGIGQWMMDQFVNMAVLLKQANYGLLMLDTVRFFLLGVLIFHSIILHYIAVWRISFDKRKLRAVAAGLSFLLLWITHQYNWPPNRSLRMTFFSVGSADMILTETRTATYLIDTGEHEGHAKILDHAMNLYKKAGLNIVLLTHEDSDHSGGIHDVLQTIPVQQILTPRVRHLPLEEYADLRHEISEPVQWTQDQWKFSLYPSGDETHLSENDRSLVLHLEGDQDLLLAADIESKREYELLPILAEVDVLKVPHHGSRTSSTEAFVGKVNPKVAVISVGPRHGHPHAEVLERYEERKVPIYRTDQHGAITYTVEGGRGFMETTYTEKNEFGFLSSLVVW